MDIFRRQKFNEAMFAKNRTLAIRVGQYQSSDIKEASFDYGYIKGDTYKPGGTCAGSGKITFTSIITAFNKLDKIYPEIGLLVDGTYEWVKMGEYFINDIEIDRNRNTTKLDLMDGMFKLNREHVTDLSYPAEIRHVIKEICLKTGIELANENMDITSMNYRIEQIPKDKKMTFRDVLSLATQMLGMSCFFNREGKLEIKELTDSGITITADSYFIHGLTKSEIEYQIAGITCKKDKETLTVGLKTGRSLELDNLFMSQSILDNLYHKIKDIRYYPFNLNYQGHLLLDVGQWVTIKTNTGETFKSPILSQSFAFKGGLRGRISADSKAGNDAQYSYTGTLTKKIEQFSEFEKQIQNQIEEADKGFDQKVDKIKKDFSDQVELAKAKTEEVKRQLSDTIDQRFSSFNNGPLQEAKRRAEEALRNAGASSLLAQEAKRISLDSIAKLEEFKRQATSAQTALSGDLDVLKRTVTSEVNQASEHRRTTTEALSRMTGQMNGFATKSEVAQGIDGLTQTFAKMKVGGRNYAEDYDFSRGLWQYSQGDSSPRDWTILNGEYNVKGTTNTYKQMQIYSKEGSRASGKNSTALLELEVGETYTLSFQGICYSGSSNVWASLRANRTVPGNPEIMYGNFNLTPSWQTYQVTIQTLTKPEDFDFWRIILGYNEIGHVAFRKVELTRSSTRIDAGPAPEDGKTDLVVAKSEFQKTAEGLRTDLSAIQEYVSQDGQRQESLQSYTREETARQANAVRELVTRDYVGKATHQEDVRGIERRFETITNPQNGLIATQIASYKTTVDGRFADISSLLSGKASQADFQRVKETSQLYERILGNTNNSIADNIARIALTNQLFQVEVGKVTRGGRNLIRNYDWNGLLPLQKLGTDWKFERIADKNAKSGYVLKATCIQGGNGGFYKTLFDLRSDEFQGKDMTSSWDMKASRSITFNVMGFEAGGLKRDVPVSTEWTRITNTFKVAFKELFSCVFYSFEWKVGDVVYIRDPQLEEGTIATSPKRALEDTEEAVRSVQSQLDGSWAVQNLTSAGSIVSQINATNNQILIEAEKIRLKGKTLLDELTAIQGYFKRLFVGEGTFATLNADVIRTNSITADKLVMDMAMARRFVSSDLFTDTLAAKEAFINKLRSVVVTATLLEGYQGRIGGFTLGQFDHGGGRWISGVNQFSVGMGNGAGYGVRTAFWANWGNNWNYAGPKAWNVNTDGKMYCRNEVGFYDQVDFSNSSSAQFYGSTYFRYSPRFTSGIHMYDQDILGNGGSPRNSGQNAVVWWNQVGEGIVKYWMDQRSDKRLKENITDTAVKALDKINRLNMVAFDFIESKKHEEIGLIAQEVETIVPRVVSRDPENPDGYLHIDYAAFVPYLLKAIQELNQKIEKMEKTIA